MPIGSLLGGEGAGAAPSALSAGGQPAGLVVDAALEPPPPPPPFPAETTHHVEMQPPPVEEQPFGEAPAKQTSIVRGLPPIVSKRNK